MNELEPGISPPWKYSAFFSSLAQYCSFKLSKCSDHLHHHAAWSSGGINRFRQTPESGFSFLNRSIIIRTSRSETNFFGILRVSSLIKRGLDSNIFVVLAVISAR